MRSNECLQMDKCKRNSKPLNWLTLFKIVLIHPSKLSVLYTEAATGGVQNKCIPVDIAKLKKKKYFEKLLRPAVS